MCVWLFFVNLVCSLHSRYHVLLFQHEKLDATSRSLKLAALSSTIKGSSTFLSSSLRSDTLCEYGAALTAFLFYALMGVVYFLHLCIADHLKIYSTAVFWSKIIVKVFLFF